MAAQNFLILGATGNIGHFLTGMALDQGHQVTALVRDASRLGARPGLTVVEGDPMDPAVLDQVMPGHDAVLSCLGIRREVQADPWSPVISPADLTGACARHTVAAMKRHGVPRVLAVSAAGIGDSRAVSSTEIMGIVDSSNIAISFRDLEEMEQVFAASGLDALMIRPVTLTGDAMGGEAKVLDAYLANSVISKQEVAAWMLEAAVRPAPYSAAAEMIGYA